MASTQDVRIDVTGEAELLLPAERAVLKVSVIRTEFAKQSAAEATIESAKKVHLVEQLHCNIQETAQISALTNT
jgi:hypothetical protein